MLGMDSAKTGIKRVSWGSWMYHAGVYPVSWVSDHREGCILVSWMDDTGVYPGSWMSDHREEVYPGVPGCITQGCILYLG